MTARTGGATAIATPAFAILWTVGFFSYANVYLTLPVFPLFLERFGTSYAAIGALVGIWSLAALVARPLLGWLSDRRGRKPLITFGLACMLVSIAVLPYASGLIAFTVLRLLGGIGWGALTSNANTLAGESAPPSRRGEALGLYTMAGSVALAIGPAAGLAISGARGYEATFLVAALLGFVALTASLFVREPRREPPRRDPFAVRDLVAVPVLAHAAVLAVNAMTYGTVVSFLPLLTKQRSLGDAGVFFTLFAVSLAVLRGVAGRLSDRYGRPAVIGPGLLFSAAAMLALALAADPWLFLAAAILLSIGMGFVQPASLAWALDIMRNRRATAMATMVAAQDLGILLGGTVLGAVGTVAGLASIFAAAAALAVVAAATVPALARRAPVAP